MDKYEQFVKFKSLLYKKPFSVLKSVEFFTLTRTLKIENQYPRQATVQKWLHAYCEDLPAPMGVSVMNRYMG